MCRQRSKPPVRRVLICRALGLDPGKGVDAAVANVEGYRVRLTRQGYTPNASPYSDCWP